MDSLGTALLSTKVVGESEPSVFETNALSMVLDRQTPAMIVRKHLHSRTSGSGVVFPSQTVLMQSLKFPIHSVDAQASNDHLNYIEMLCRNIRFPQSSFQITSSIHANVTNSPKIYLPFPDSETYETWKKDQSINLKLNYSLILFISLYMQVNLL